uniref:HTH CENPB-type domain-containing protein n=1 Tax=Acrobeloides nanus TaxID=290746 RepID=A0A914E152_9BILA
MGYSHQLREFFMECLKQRTEPNFDVLMKMDFCQQALKIFEDKQALEIFEENKARLAKCVQAIIIAETRDTVPARWFHKFMNRENAKIYDTSNQSSVMAHFPVPRTRTAKILRMDPELEENLKVKPDP